MHAATQRSFRNTVLIVGLDNELIRTRETLSQLSECHVIAAFSEDNAMELLRKYNFDLVVIGASLVNSDLLEKRIASLRPKPNVLKIHP
jgi:hypothetical protein